MAATKKSGSKSGPCWEGYKKVGMKKKGGKSGSGLCAHKE
jgi:hypothetical protein